MRRKLHSIILPRLEISLELLEYRFVSRLNSASDDHLGLVDAPEIVPNRPTRAATSDAQHGEENEPRRACASTRHL